MVSRDREIAKTVVYGIREIISLLRSIRDGQAEEVKSLTRENRRLQEELIAVYRRQESMAPVARDLHRDFPPCERAGCSLPEGHFEPHRGSLRHIG